LEARTICMSAATGSNDSGLDHLVSPTLRYKRFRLSSLGYPNTSLSVQHLRNGKATY
jgi:hypothetical protein